MEGSQLFCDNDIDRIISALPEEQVKRQETLHDEKVNRVLSEKQTKVQTPIQDEEVDRIISHFSENQVLKTVHTSSIHGLLKMDLKLSEKGQTTFQDEEMDRIISSMSTFHDDKVDFIISCLQEDQIILKHRGKKRKRIDIKCCICLEEYEDEVFFQLHCQHGFCVDCLKEWIRHAVDSKQIPLICPKENCSVEVYAEHVQQLLPQPLFQAFQQMELTHVFKQDLFYCPNPTCSKLLWKTEEIENHVMIYTKCRYCGIELCMQCKSLMHHGYTCAAYQRLPSEEDIQFLQLANQKAWKKCPSCSIMIERIMGCNHMSCTCGKQFCYKCGKLYNSDRTPGCRCRLFHVPPDRYIPARRPIYQRPVPPRRPRSVSIISISSESESESIVSNGTSESESESIASNGTSESESTFSISSESIISITDSSSSTGSESSNQDQDID